MSDKKRVSEPSRQLFKAVLNSLEESKGQDIKCLEVAEITTVADYMIVVTGTSSRHVRALATNAVNDLREQGVRALGIEGEETGDWILIDFGDVVVHVMQAEVRSFYDLESLWQTEFSQAIHDD